MENQLSKPWDQELDGRELDREHVWEPSVSRGTRLAGRRAAPLATPNTKKSFSLFPYITRRGHAHVINPQLAGVKSATKGHLESPLTASAANN